MLSLKTRRKINFLIPQKMEKEIETKMLQHGCKSKNQWISEAIEKLLNIDDYIEYVKISDSLEGCNKTQTIRVSEDFYTTVNSAILQVKKVYPLMDGVKSRLVRTAIMQRIIRE